MARMIPPTIDPKVKSNAERRIYGWFEKLEWNKCVVLHSLGIANHTRNIFGEIDFVVISTEGILCIEVKGGQVYRKNGLWVFKNRYGEESTKHIGPFEQAQGNMQSLRLHMVNRLAKEDALAKCQYACCVMTPDCVIRKEEVDIIPDIIFDGEHVSSDLISFLNKSMNYWRKQCYEKHGFEGGKLNEEDIERAVDVLRGDFRFVPSLAVMVNRTEEQLLAVTEEQYIIMEGFDENDRLLVSGPAGTGKTLLAIEQCRRLSAQGKKVLYLCYNKLISLYVRELRNQESDTYDVYNLHSLMLRECAMDENYSNTDDFFLNELPFKFIQRFKEAKYELVYDAIVIDEGQDLMNMKYCECIDMILKNGLKQGIWTVFFDQEQNLFNKKNEFFSVWNKLKLFSENNYKLTINCRNTMQIAIANQMISNFLQARQLRANGNEVVYLSYSSIKDERKKLIDVIRNLRTQGIALSDVVILSPYIDKSCVYNMLIPSDIGKIRINPKNKLFSKKGVDFYTIQAYKGLESKVVIIIDIDDFESEQRRLLNYVAVSRARTMLYVIYDEKKEGERQKMLLQGALM